MFFYACFSFYFLVNFIPLFKLPFGNYVDQSGSADKQRIESLLKEVVSISVFGFVSFVESSVGGWAGVMGRVPRGMIAILFGCR